MFSDDDGRLIEIAMCKWMAVDVLISDVERQNVLVLLADRDNLYVVSDFEFFLYGNPILPRASDQP